jgi:glycosyltransferase involved in cell wall biosynthesis
MLALSSDHEGFPNVVLEAMAAKLPVIATPVGDVAAVVQHEITGFIVSLDDTEEMANRMVLLGTSRELRARFGHAGRVRLEHEYNFENLPNRLIQTYNAIAEQQSKRSVLARLG